MNYNTAFFGLFENIFKLTKIEFGETKALEIFARLMEMGLSKSYGLDFIKGQPDEFKRIVAERDNLVGLRVGFPSVSPTEIIYRFYDDPFPNLKGLVDPLKLDNCYMSFKLNYILGEGWEYTTTKHIWSGDEFTEHRIHKK